MLSRLISVFFFQAEDGIRDIGVTGVQTCALPIYSQRGNYGAEGAGDQVTDKSSGDHDGSWRNRGDGHGKLGRASGRERVPVSGGAGTVDRVIPVRGRGAGLRERGAACERRGGAHT